MKKIFLSLPMKGKTEAEIESELEKMKEWYRKNYPEQNENIVFIDNSNCKLPTWREEISPSYCLGEAIKKLGICDILLLAPYWRSAKGCNVEFSFAQEYGLDVIRIPYYEEDLE